MTEAFQGRTVVARRVLIKFKASPDAAALADIRNSAAATYFEPIGGAGWYLLDSSSLSSAQLISKLSASLLVAKVEPDYVGHPMAVIPSNRPRTSHRPMFDVPNDPFYPLQWAFNNTNQCVNGFCGQPGDDINAESAWTIHHGSPQMVIADFDTGIDFNNPDLAANVWSAPSAYTITEGGNVYNCPQGSHGINVIDFQSGCAGQELDTYGHGTFTAGVADAATDNGVGIAATAWNVPIISIKMCTEQTCDSATTITAIDAALQIEQHFGLKIVAGNMSHGNLGGSALEDEMSLAGQYGMLFTASTGDECRGGADDPASFYLSNEIAVAASDQQNDVAGWTGGCSNGGGNIAAPGKNVYTTVMGDNGNGPAALDGTSLSAPFVAGAIALLESACPGLEISSVIPTLEGTADKISTLTSIATNGNLLNLGNALASCTSGTPGTAGGAISLSRQLPEDTGTVVINIDGQEVSEYSYDTTVDTAASIAQGLVANFYSPYATASYTGSGQIQLTTTALGPYTGYSANAQVFDNCQPGDGCGTPPHAQMSSFTPGHN